MIFPQDELDPAVAEKSVLDEKPEEKETSNRHRPSKMEFYMAWFTVFSCLSSISTVIVSYQRLSAAASEVEEVVDNWGEIPIDFISVIPAIGSCPSGSTLLDKMKLNEPEDLGCGCSSIPDTRHDGKIYKRYG